MGKFVIILFCFVFLFLGGCDNLGNGSDFGKYSFTDIAWKRDNGHDVEVIRFGSDGSFSYSCSCGNPVNDADLCEYYNYNEDSKEIKLECYEITDDTIKVIKIINFSDTELELDFDGEIRKFKNVNDGDVKYE